MEIPEYVEDIAIKYSEWIVKERWFWKTEQELWDKFMEPKYLTSKELYNKFLEENFKQKS